MLPRNKLMMLDEWIPLLLVVGTICLIDISTWPINAHSDPRSLVARALVGGLVLGQAAVLNLVLVFGSGPYWLRALVCGSLGVAAIGCWFWGASLEMRQPYYDGRPPEFMPVLGFAAYLMLVAQVPLWATRLLFGKRFVSTGTGATPADKQFSLADLVAATAVICLTAAAIRAGDALDPRRADDYWRDQILAGATAVLFSLVFVLFIVTLFFTKASLPTAWTVSILWTLPTWAMLGAPTASFGFRSRIPDINWLVVFACTVAIGAACSLLRVCDVQWNVTKNKMIPSKPD